MGTIQFDNHKILFKDGKIAFHPDCCCNEPPIECSQCAVSTPAKWTVTISDVLFCTGCVNFGRHRWLTYPTTEVNGTWILRQEYDCVWAYEEPCTVGRWNDYYGLSTGCSGNFHTFDVHTLRIQYQAGFFGLQAGYIGSGWGGDRFAATSLFTPAPGARRSDFDGDITAPSCSFDYLGPDTDAHATGTRYPAGS